MMRAKHGHSFIEFSLSLFVLIILSVFPLINLLGTVLSAAAILLLTHETVSIAAVQQDFQGSLAASSATANTILKSELGRFLKIKPMGGYKNSGVDLYVTITNFHTGKTEAIGPNLALTDRADALENIYEYTTSCVCKAGPLVSLDSVPLLREIPGLGKPATMRFQASRAIEHLQNTKLADRGTANNLSLSDTANSGSSIDPTGGDWNNSDIYQQIAKAGQTVTASDVLIVDANNENWTISKAYAAAGQRIWIDTRTDGQWSGSLTSQPFDANGYSPPFIAGMPAGALEGRLGDSGQPYMSGKSQINFVPPTGSGYVEFRFNDEPGRFYMNNGRMIVRVIVTKVAG